MFNRFWRHFKRSLVSTSICDKSLRMMLTCYFVLETLDKLSHLMFSLLNVGGVDRCGHLLGLVITPRLSAL